MADSSAVPSMKALSPTADAWDLVHRALASGEEGAPAWPAAALDMLRQAVREVRTRLARVRAMGFGVDASPGLASLATHLGLSTADAAAVVEEGCEAA